MSAEGDRQLGKIRTQCLFNVNMGKDSETQDARTKKQMLNNLFDHTNSQNGAMKHTHTFFNSFLC